MITDEQMTRPAPQTHRIRAAGADLHVEVRGQGPTIVLHAAPMDARAFEALAADLAADHLVVTIDPRGIARSAVDDRSAIVDPDTRADDVARVITALDLAPAVVFGSSGGAVSALALAARSPELLTAVVAHEPPLALLVPDHETLRRETEDMIATYTSGDRVGYWRQFLASAAIDIPDEVFDQWFAAAPTGRDADDERFGVEQMEMATTFWEPPLDTLRTNAVPIVVGIGDDSQGQLCDRTSRALADALGGQPTAFPGDHVGFTEHPSAFAEILRSIAGALSVPPDTRREWGDGAWRCTPVRSHRPTGPALTQRISPPWPES